MALPTQELRYKKAGLYLFIGMCTIMAITMPIIQLSFDPGPKRWPAYLSSITTLLILAGIIYFLIRRLRNNDPVITFMSHGLVITKGNRTILWGDITEWKIKRSKSNYRLVIRTANSKRSMDITWLDQDHKAIKSMMETYIRQLS